jgi:16S rRNA (uracil1498-N3)-methyltransferase
MRTGHIPRFHVAAELAAGATIELPREAAHHATRVLRLRIGESLTLFNGSGGEYAATIASIERGGATVALGAHQAHERESPLAITLVQGIAGADRMDFIIQKAVELGVAAIQPVLTSKSIVRLSKERGEARLAHWQRIVIAACEQCGRNRIPEVFPAESLAVYSPPPDAVKVLLSPQATTDLKALAQSPLVLAVGPEAGFDSAEEQLLAQKGFVAARLGPRILRTETAALAALAALNAIRGDF